MPAPTALLRAPEALAKEETVTRSESEIVPEDVDPVTNPDRKDVHAASDVQDTMQVDTESRPFFKPETASKVSLRPESRKIHVPPHRMTPLKSQWPKIYPPLVQHLKLQVRMLPHKKIVELRTSKYTTDAGALQKAADFVRAFCFSFDVDDAIALLRLDDLYIETFEIKDVKTLGGEHLSRAIGRIAGQNGKTKYAIENATKTRVSLEGQTVHILGGFKNIHMAREAVVSLILGSPPGKVYGNLRTVSARMKERF